MGENSSIQWTHHTPMTTRQRGALKSAARKTGCSSVEEWLTRREAGLLRCRTCRSWLPKTDFTLDRSRRSLRQSACRDCMTLVSAASRYGIARPVLERMHEEQRGECAICKRSSRRLVLDHCHASGRVRGLLCDRCNVGLGHIERTGFVEDARRYLGHG